MENNKGDLPLVSICIPTYNSEKYIEKMLISIINQTYKNIEVIISDNCSIDSTYEILKKYVHLENWKISQNSVNIGALNNMNLLINLVQGEYTAIYHADDIYEAEIVEKSVHVLLNQRSVALVATMANSIDGEDKLLSTFNLPKNFEDRNIINFDTVFSEILSQRPFFLITPSIMTRSKYYKEGIKLNPRYKSAADYGLWFNILQKGQLYIINQPLISYRTHDQQGSQNEIKENYKIPDSLQLYEDYAEINKTLHWKGYQYSYFKLMLIQAIKLNNSGRFKRSRIFLDLIVKYTDRKFSLWIIGYRLLNILNLKFSLSNLIALKKIFRK